MNSILGETVLQESMVNKDIMTQKKKDCLIFPSRFSLKKWLKENLQKRKDIIKEGILEHHEGRNNNGQARDTDGEKMDQPHFDAGNVKWYSLSGKLSGSF